jgi:polar amino acid transport system substrate-binding protein
METPMSIFRIAAALLISASAALTALICPVGAQTVDEIKAKGRIDIGIVIDIPPVGFMNAENKAAGYDADVAALLAKELGVQLNLLPVTGPNRIPYLTSRRVDVLVAALGITPERAERVLFTEPYANMQLLVFGEKKVAVAKPADLSGKRIGFARGGAQDLAISPIAPPDTVIQRFNDDASAVQALISGQVELIGSMNTIAPEVERQAPGRFETKFVVTHNPLGIAVRQGSTELLAYLNSFVQRIKVDGRLNAIHQKWLGSPLPDLSNIAPVKR